MPCEQIFIRDQALASHAIASKCSFTQFVLSWMYKRQCLRRRDLEAKPLLTRALTGSYPCFTHPGLERQFDLFMGVTEAAARAGGGCNVIARLYKEAARYGSMTNRKVVQVLGPNVRMQQAWARAWLEEHKLLGPPDTTLVGPPELNRLKAQLEESVIVLMQVGYWF